MAIDFSTIDEELLNLTLEQFDAIIYYVQNDREPNCLPETLWLKIKDITLIERIILGKKLQDIYTESIGGFGGDFEI